MTVDGASGSAAAGSPSASRLTLRPVPPTSPNTCADGCRPTGRQVIHDLGCGTGAMGRWLAPRLPGPQHWVVHDRDAELLAVAAEDLPGEAADGAAVTVETRQSDITRLRAERSRRRNPHHRLGTCWTC